jgi:uncharacterized protein with HEPN domain
MTEKAKKYLSDILQAIELINEFSTEVPSFSAYQKDLKSKSAIEVKKYLPPLRDEISAYLGD